MQILDFGSSASCLMVLPSIFTRFHPSIIEMAALALPLASVAALGLLSLVPGSTNQLRVHELRSTDTKTVCDLRTAVFSSHLQKSYSKILQGRKWEESMQEKTKVLVARASRELADVLLAEDNFVGFAGDEDEPIIGTADMKLVPIPGQAGGFCCYVNNVCVDPCARRRGVAAAMMDVVDVLSVRELGASALALHVDVDNAPAVRLYERCQAMGQGLPSCFATTLCHLLLWQRRVSRHGVSTARGFFLVGTLRRR